jgi:hypothetical protein
MRVLLMSLLMTPFTGGCVTTHHKVTGIADDSDENCSWLIKTEVRSVSFIAFPIGTSMTPGEEQAFYCCGQPSGGTPTCNQARWNQPNRPNTTNENPASDRWQTWGTTQNLPRPTKPNTQSTETAVRPPPKRMRPVKQYPEDTQMTCKEIMDLVSDGLPHTMIVTLMLDRGLKSGTSECLSKKVNSKRIKQTAESIDRQR